MWRTLQTVEYGEKVSKGQGEGPPGKQGEPPGEAQEDGQACDAARVCQHSPPGGLVVGVLPLDAGQLDHDHDEDQQAESEDQEEVGHHAHVEGDVITQPAAAGGQRSQIRFVHGPFHLFTGEELTIDQKFHLNVWNTGPDHSCLCPPIW